MHATKALYDGNNVNAVKAAFIAGTSTTSADPNVPYYIFKIVNGASESDVYYGMLQILTNTPGISATYE